MLYGLYPVIYNSTALQFVATVTTTLFMPCLSEQPRYPRRLSDTRVPQTLPRPREKKGEPPHEPEAYVGPYMARLIWLRPSSHC